MIYKNEYLREISFPIGGIGSGCFGIAGNGELCDWELFNHPNKGSLLRFSHIAVKAKTAAGTVVRILQGDHITELTGRYGGKPYSGFGFGPDNGTMCGFPHFREVTFNGRFPTADVTFSDPDFPGEVTLSVLSPFIPLDSESSSLPVGIFRIEFRNPTDQPIEYSAVFSLANPFEKAYNREQRTANGHFVTLGSYLPKDDLTYGDLTLGTPAGDTEVQEYWYRGGFSDHLDVFIRQLCTEDRLPPRHYDEERTVAGQDIASLASHITLSGGKSGSRHFVLSWYVPNRRNDWRSAPDPTPWKNYYATRFASSMEVAEHCIADLDKLVGRTEAFRDALHNSSIDPVVIDAAASVLSVLRSATVMRLEDGSFYGFEGVNEHEGSCEGTCQHVWNYAYALCFLFPDLERSIRDNEFTYCTEENGRTHFRIRLPRNGFNDFRACLDGQMGCVIKTLREWRISGDSDWLRRVYPTVKKILAYAWSEENPDAWDRDRDGVLEGRQHHTLDMELFGPSAWLQGMYLAALRAGAEMADFMGDGDFAAECRRMFASGAEFVRRELWNGEYFIQKLDLSDKTPCIRFDCEGDYWYEESGELKYQIGEGCEIDQLLGEWHARLCGLGDLFDKEQKKTALQSLMRYNFKPTMRNCFNTWRVFSLCDEGGCVMCEFPKARPTVPLPYYAETMTGFEYALAGLMLSEGMTEEGLTLVRAVRDRYDGKKRNPYNEIECGSNYARAMASFALLPLLCGLSYDLPHGKMGFAPADKENFNCFFSLGTGWGTLAWSQGAAAVRLTEGSLTLQELDIPARAKHLLIDGRETAFEQEGDAIRFAPCTVTRELLVRF